MAVEVSLRCICALARESVRRWLRDSHHQQALRCGEASVPTSAGVDIELCLAPGSSLTKAVAAPGLHVGRLARVTAAFTGHHKCVGCHLRFVCSTLTGLGIMCAATDSTRFWCLSCACTNRVWSPRVCHATPSHGVHVLAELFFHPCRVCVCMRQRAAAPTPGPRNSCGPSHLAGDIAYFWISSRLRGQQSTGLGHSQIAGSEQRV